MRPHGPDIDPAVRSHNDVAAQCGTLTLVELTPGVTFDEVQATTEPDWVQA